MKDGYLNMNNKDR